MKTTIPVKGDFYREAEVSELENKEQGFIPYGGKLAVFDDCCLMPPTEYEKMSEETKRIIDKLNAPITIKPIVLRGDKIVRFH